MTLGISVHGVIVGGGADDAQFDRYQRKMTRRGLATDPQTSRIGRNLLLPRRKRLSLSEAQPNPDRVPQQWLEHTMDDERSVVIENERFSLLVRSLESAIRVGPIPIPALLATVAGCSVLVAFQLIARLLDLPWLLSLVGGGAAYTSVAVAVQLYAWPAKVRAAYELYAWLHLRELAALPPDVLPIPTSFEQAGRWLRSHLRSPRTDALRLELLTWTSRFEEAYEIVDSLAGDSPAARFRKEAARDFVDFMAGGPGAASSLEPLCEAIDDPVQRVEAQIVVAMHRARSKLVGGEDWLEPLGETRRAVRHITDGTISQIYLVPILRQNALYGGALALLFHFLSVNG